jgi:hypothetical protein
MIIVRFPVNPSLSGEEKTQFEEFPLGREYYKDAHGGLQIRDGLNNVLGDIAPHTWVSVKKVETPSIRR